MGGTGQIWTNILIIHTNADDVVGTEDVRPGSGIRRCRDNALCALDLISCSVTPRRSATVTGEEGLMMDPVVCEYYGTSQTVCVLFDCSGTLQTVCGWKADRVLAARRRSTPARPVDTTGRLAAAKPQDRRQESGASDDDAAPPDVDSDVEESAVSLAPDCGSF